MREIRFRAWNATMHKMIDLQKITPLATDLAGLFIPFSDDIFLMQFTGLHDKNGREIYEGDILQTAENGTCQVVYNKELVAFALKGLEHWDCYFGRTPSSFFKVTGNIYENPELLFSPAQLKEMSDDLIPERLKIKP